MYNKQSRLTMAEQAEQPVDQLTADDALNIAMEFASKVAKKPKLEQCPSPFEELHSVCAYHLLEGENCFTYVIKCEFDDMFKRSVHIYCIQFTNSVSGATYGPYGFQEV